MISTSCRVRPSGSSIFQSSYRFPLDGAGIAATHDHHDVCGTDDDVSGLGNSCSILMPRSFMTAAAFGRRCSAGVEPAELTLKASPA